MRRSQIALLVALVAPLAAGCESNHYEITLVPRAGQLERSLDAWREDGSDGPNKSPKPLGDPEIKKLVEAYQLKAAPAAKGNKLHFSGKFAGNMPGDIGGAGQFVRWTTQLGSVSIYCERFRGNDDLAGIVERRTAAAGQLADLLVAWFEVELKNDRRWPEVQSFLDDDLRRDLRNLVVYYFVAETSSNDQAVTPEKRLATFTACFGQYLVERNYLTPQDAPAAIRMLSGGGDGALKFARSLLARRLGLAQRETDEQFKFLSDDPTMKRSYDQFITTDPRFRAILAKARERWSLKSGDQGSPHERDLFELLCYEAGFQFLRADDKLSVTLAVAKKPVSTNGTWDAAKSRVVWANTIAPRAAVPDLTPPAVHYAVWSEPDAKFQATVFGKTLVDADLLARYCLWHESLSPAEQTEWDAFIAKLQPGQDPAQAIANFAFPSQPNPNSPPGERVSATPHQLMLEAGQRQGK